MTSSDSRSTWRDRRRPAAGALPAAALLGAAAALSLAARAPHDAPAPGVLDGTALVLRGPDGAPYARIERAADGTATFELHDQAQRARIRMRVAPDGTPTVTLADEAGGERVELAVLNEATPRILLRDADGRERMKSLLMPDGSPMLYLKDSEARNRVELTSFADRVHALIVFGTDGAPIGIVGGLPDGGRGMVWMDDEGAPRVKMGVNERGEVVSETFPKP